MIRRKHGKLIISMVVYLLWFGGTAVLWGIGTELVLPLGLAWMILVYWLANRWVAWRGW